ncbi:MAG TPA: DEAD/DEAH box helicase family protein [Thermoflexia bacterium]|nr:DEAD/DEAH box helicase family protein [Thermoflexia bacterium]
MAQELLQEMVAAISFDELSPAWNSFDLKTFSRDKQLWDYQQAALRNALRALQRYYDEWSDYRPGEARTRAQARKIEFCNWYKRNGLDLAELEIVLKNHTIKNREMLALLENYYQPVREEKLQVNKRVYFRYRDFINRMCFWMATGSGKTLILIKLLELLKRLVELDEIPDYDILVLTYRDDLIAQFQAQVQEFNAWHADLSIRLYSLKDYEQVKRGPRPLPGELPVFIYRSDNLSDVAGQKILDFRSYENDGQWYVLLDEAHKGDRNESKRQHIYSILSRKGFLFNFSATFTDERDVATTVCNFNLAEFIRAGYGKHIVVLEQEIRAFRDKKEDYSAAEKQRIVLKSLLMLAYTRQFYAELQPAGAHLYHSPLLVMMGHTVNTDKADVKLFFRELVKIGKGEVAAETWQAAKDELWAELRQRPPFMFEQAAVHVQEKRFRALSLDDLRDLVFNERSPGEIEVLKRPSNHKEVAFKLKTGEQPFALIKIGDISGWLKGELVGYEANETFEDESYFERLDEDDSDINILMGSRTFYEGWDSNRPNVMNFVNIGMGTEARKFILQSVGRGVRIEPVPNARRRLLPLSNAAQVKPATFKQVSDRGDPRALPIETLFIFGTNRSALHFVIDHLDQVRRKEEVHTLSLSLNEQVAQHQLLIPIFQSAERLLVEERTPPKFETTVEEQALLATYVGALDDRILLARYGLAPQRIAWLRRGLEHVDTYFRTTGKATNHLDLLTRRVSAYFGVVPPAFKRLKELDDEIQHFRRIKVTLRDIYSLQQKIAKVEEYPVLREKLEAQYGQLSFDEFERQRRELHPTTFFEYAGQRIRIEYIAQHYYIPTILADSARVDYVKHIIKVPSEVQFVNDLNDYVAQSTNLFDQFDWWFFSKLDEHLDRVYLPYYDPKANRIRKFKPDFIFWFQKGADYYIVFIDPKGAEHTDYQHKIDGYRQLFEDENGVRAIERAGLTVRVFTFLRTPDVNVVPAGYRRYWLDDMNTLLSQLLQTSVDF